MTVTVTVGTPTQNAGGVNISVLMPATKSGDLTVVCVWGNGVNAATITPAGWTALFGTGQQPVGVTNAIANVFWRAWQPGDIGNKTFGFTVSGALLAVPLLVLGADLAAPVESSASTPSPSTALNTDIPAPSLTPVRSRLLVTFHTARTNAAGVRSFTPPPTMTEISDYGPGSTLGQGGIETCTKVLADASPTGVMNARCTVATFPVAFSLLLQAPAPPGTVTKGKGGAAISLRYKGQPAAVA